MTDCTCPNAERIHDLELRMDAYEVLVDELRDKLQDAGRKLVFDWDD